MVKGKGCDLDVAGLVNCSSGAKKRFFYNFSNRGVFFCISAVMAAATSRDCSIALFHTLVYRKPGCSAGSAHPLLPIFF